MALHHPRQSALLLLFTEGTPFAALTSCGVMVAMNLHRPAAAACSLLLRIWEGQHRDLFQASLEAAQ